MKVKPDGKGVLRGIASNVLLAAQNTLNRTIHLGDSYVAVLLIRDLRQLLPCGTESLTMTAP